MIMLLFLKAWEGVGVVSSACKFIASRYPLQANLGTIRGDLAVQTGRLGPLISCVSLVCAINHSGLEKLFIFLIENYLSANKVL